jgi:hypothetical protein
VLDKKNGSGIMGKGKSRAGERGLLSEKTDCLCTMK